LYLTLRYQAVTRQSMIWAGFLGVSPMQRVLTATRVLAEYLGLFLFPRTLLPDYWKSEVPVPTSMLDKGVLLALLVWIALAILVVWKLRRHRSLVLAVAWFFVTILPASNILFPTGIAKAERVLYLPSVGLCLVVGWIYTLVEGKLAQRRLLPLAAVPILLALAARTVVRNRDWKDNFTLVSAGLLISPQSPLMNAIAAEELVKRGEAVRAVPLLHEALRQAPTMPGLHTHLGAAYAALGNNSAAVGEYRIALQVNPNDADALNNLGIAHLDTQQNDSAIVILESFLRLRPNDARAENNLGVAYFRRGDLAQAMQHYRRALQLQPDYSRAQVNLNRAMWQQQNAAVKK
jgi:Flp pilus assembly protein TadD